MLKLNHCLIFSALLFAIGLGGIIFNRKNLISLLMCLEIILLAINTNFVAFAHFLKNIDGQIFVFFILTVAAAESAVGLAIIVLLFKERKTININDLNLLKG